jgi:hypothetical protein
MALKIPTGQHGAGAQASEALREGEVLGRPDLKNDGGYWSDEHGQVMRRMPHSLQA